MTFATVWKLETVSSGQWTHAYMGMSALVAAMVISTSYAANDAPAPRNAKELVAAAAEAEIAGDAAKASTLLQDAIKADPNNQIARWQLGQLRVDGIWMPAEEAQQLAAKDPSQTEYRQRRAAAGRNVGDQAKLARWCRENKLADEAQLHWGVVLSLEPNNKEALRALDLLWKDGQLVTRGESSQQKQQFETAKAAARRWEPLVAKWRRAVAGRDILAHDSALAEIRAIHELEAIPFMEAVTLGRDANNMQHAEECLQIAVAFIDALGKMPEPSATESLVRHAVFSPGNKARALAIEKLKPRDQHDYVPMLLSGLAMPIESSFNVATDEDGNVRYAHTLYREGPESDWSYDLRKRTDQQNLGGRFMALDTNTSDLEVGQLTESPAVVAARKAAVASKSQAKYANTAVATEARVSERNEAIEATNMRIIPVLSATTDKDFGESPKAWWDWWRSRNEYYSSEHPVDQHYDSEYNHYYYGFPNLYTYSTAPPPPRPRGPYSCFAKGTLVWTKTGKVPIEQVELGDFVLSQNVDSGELTYKPVLGKTIRPPSPMLKITTSNETLVTTLGHPFWVTGAGWRMAKELGDDAKLHGAKGVTSVRAIEQVPDADAYNLIVGDFNTYFVGESGILVHDNTPRRPAQMLIPGIAKN